MKVIPMWKLWIHHSLRQHLLSNKPGVSHQVFRSDLEDLKSHPHPLQRNSANPLHITTEKKKCTAVKSGTIVYMSLHIS